MATSGDHGPSIAGFNAGSYYGRWSHVSRRSIAISVIITVKVPGDTGTFKKSLGEHAGEYRKIADRAKERGALHHRFGVGDGFIVIDDEWESADEFTSFFSDPELISFMGTVGATPNVAPEITVSESIDSPDRF